MPPSEISFAAPSPLGTNTGSGSHGSNESTPGIGGRLALPASVTGSGPLLNIRDDSSDEAPLVVVKRSKSKSPTPSQKGNKLAGKHQARDTKHQITRSVSVGSLRTAGDQSVASSRAGRKTFSLRHLNPDFLLDEAIRLQATESQKTPSERSQKSQSPRSAKRSLVMKAASDDGGEADRKNPRVVEHFDLSPRPSGRPMDTSGTGSSWDLVTVPDGTGLTPTSIAASNPDTHGTLPSPPLPPPPSPPNFGTHAESGLTFPEGPPRSLSPMGLAGDEADLKDKLAAERTRRVTAERKVRESEKRAKESLDKLKEMEEEYGVNTDAAYRFSAKHAEAEKHVRDLQMQVTALEHDASLRLANYEEEAARLRHQKGTERSKAEELELK